MRGASTPSSTHPSSKVKAITVNDIINMMIITPKPILWKWWLIKMFRSMEATYTEVTREVRARDILLYLHHDDDHKNDHYHDYISRITMMIILGIEMMITLVLTTRWPPPPCPTWKRWSRSLSNEPRIFVRNQPRPGDLFVMVIIVVMMMMVVVVIYILWCSVCLCVCNEKWSLPPGSLL